MFWYGVEGLAAQAGNVVHATDVFTLCGSFYVMGVSPRGKKEKGNGVNRRRGGREGALGGNSVCKNWEGAAANCFARSENFLALCQTQARAQKRSEVSRKSISGAPHGSASSTRTVPFCPQPELCELPTLGGRVFPMGMSRPEVPRSLPAQSYPGSFQASPWSLLPLLGTCEERSQDKPLTL